MVERIKSALEKLFQRYRVVFWYDDSGEMKEVFEQLNLDVVEKVMMANNEFGTKYQILIQKPTTPFLVYQPSPKPVPEENWLLDLNLAFYEFHAEPASLYLQDLGLTQEFLPIVEQHEKFFANEKNLKSLSEIIETGDRETTLRIKMLSVICDTEPDWEKILYALFEDLLRDKNTRIELFARYKLNNFFWEHVERKFGYKETSPSLRDLAAKLLLNNFQRALPNGKPTLTKDAYIFVNRWKENSKAQQIFEELSDQIGKALGVESQVNEIPTEDLLNANSFSEIDRKILVGLRDGILKETLSNQTVQEWIDKRRWKYFFKAYANLYEALSNGSMMLDEIRKTQFYADGIKEMFFAYSKQYYRIDFLYRKYIYFSEHAEHQNLLKDLTEKMEKAYTNSYLLPLANRWQQKIDKLSSWTIDGVENQREFYRNHVKSVAEKGNRIFVIISDALRYEAASEMRDLILKEDRYSADLKPLLSTLPSYTQLGMAALLPHSDLRFADGDDSVFADDQSTKGTESRSKVLQKALPASVAITADDFLSLNSHDGREFVKPYQVVYIYHNKIDKVGDDKTSEGTVFDAVEDEFETFIKLMKQIANMNGNNMLITSDHGFLYQHDHLAESDFNDFTPEGASINKVNRRYVIGRHLNRSDALMLFTASQLGLSGDHEVLIPKSINRLRVQGAGSRYVHGGATLQEIVVPVIEINKKRKSDIEFVDVDILGGMKKITSNQFGINFYQRQPVAEKMLERQITAGFYTLSGKPISDVVTLNFNSDDRDSTAREKRHVFTFISDAVQYNNQEVELQLDEPVEGTTLKRPYQRHRFLMLISFGSEFDV